MKTGSQGRLLLSLGLVSKGSWGPAFTKDFRVRLLTWDQASPSPIPTVSTVSPQSRLIPDQSSFSWHYSHRPGSLTWGLCLCLGRDRCLSRVGPRSRGKRTLPWPRAQIWGSVSPPFHPPCTAGVCSPGPRELQGSAGFWVSKLNTASNSAQRKTCHRLL